MRPLTFNPGPSKISDDTYADIERACRSGILEWSHRSQNFYTLSTSAIELLKRYFHVPEEYHVLFLNSASSAWHSLITNTVSKKSLHLINGAFSKKAHNASMLLYKDAHSIEANLGTQIAFDSVSVSDDTELITACYNESSTGGVYGS